MEDTSNRGHGHVYPRGDGVKNRCGGPAVCMECAADLAELQTAEKFAKDTLAHQYVEPHAVAAQMLEAMKAQLLIVLVNHLGGSVRVPVSEIDATGGWMMSMEVDQIERTFTFKTSRKA